MKKIKLSKDKYAIVDDEDFPYLNRFSWTATQKGAEDGKWYAQMIKQRDNKDTAIQMHELVIDLENSDCIGFKNGDSLDYRKENLFAVDYGMRMQRSSKYRIANATSKFKGLTYRKKKKVWEVRISKDNQSFYLGSFKSEKKAANKYNEKAIELYGKYAYQNKL